jgi:hypothetical protein
LLTSEPEISKLREASIEDHWFNHQHVGIGRASTDFAQRASMHISTVLLDLKTFKSQSQQILENDKDSMKSLLKKQQQKS